MRRKENKPKPPPLPPPLPSPSFSRIPYSLKLFGIGIGVAALLVFTCVYVELEEDRRLDEAYRVLEIFERDQTANFKSVIVELKTLTANVRAITAVRELTAMERFDLNDWLSSLAELEAIRAGWDARRVEWDAMMAAVARVRVAHGLPEVPEGRGGRTPATAEFDAVLAEFDDVAAELKAAIWSTAHGPDA